MIQQMLAILKHVVQGSLYSYWHVIGWIIYIYTIQLERLLKWGRSFFSRILYFQRQRAMGTWSGKNTVLKHPGSGHELPEEVTLNREKEAGARQAHRGHRSRACWGAGRFPGGCFLHCPVSLPTLLTLLLLRPGPLGKRPPRCHQTTNVRRDKGHRSQLAGGCLGLPGGRHVRFCPDTLLFR